MKKLLMLTASGLIVSSIPAIAGHHEGTDHEKGEKVKEMFSAADANSDGTISKDEYIAHVTAKAEEKFAEKDTNGDGDVTKEEAKAYADAKREKMQEKRGEMREKIKEKREKMKDRKSESDVSAE